MGTGRGNNLAGSRESRSKGREVGNTVNDKRWQMTGVGGGHRTGRWPQTLVAPAFLVKWTGGNAPWGSCMAQW